VSTKCAALAIAIAGFLVAAPSAEASPAEASAHFTQARAAFDRGDFGEAVAQFDAAFAAAPGPEILWNVAQSLRRWYDVDHDLAHLRRALEVYDKFSQLSTNLEERSEAVRERGAVEEEIARRTPKPTGVIAPTVTKPAVDPFAHTETPVYRRWWLWTIVAVVVAAGAATATYLVLTHDQAPTTNGGEYSIHF
jgi:hypothetical protein